MNLQLYKLDSSYKEEAFNWAKGCNFNLALLVTLGVGDDDILTAMTDSKTLNEKFMKLLNTEFHLDLDTFTETEFKKFDSLMYHCATKGIQCCEKLVDVLNEKQDQSLIALVYETNKMKDYYIAISQTYAGDGEIATRLTADVFESITAAEED
jgi:hypothetical protein